MLKSIFSTLSTAICAAIMLLTGCGSRPEAPVSSLVFERWEDGYHYYRIPAVVTAADGSIIAVCDRRGADMKDLPNEIDVVAKRSVDGGKTWSEVIVIVEHKGVYGYGDPALVVDKASGDVICIYARGSEVLDEDLPHDRALDILVSRSHDNGQTWDEPYFITDMILGKNCPNTLSQDWVGGFASSGNAVQLSNGDLAFVLAAWTTVDNISNFVCISSDGGYNWRLLPFKLNDHGDESKMVELSDGSWLMSIRTGGNHYRKFARSTDYGQTWTEPAECKDVKDPTCNGDMIVYTSIKDGFEKDRIIHSIPFSREERENVSVLMSYDGGKTWPVRKTIWEGLAGYSSLNVLPNGDIGLFTEVGGWDEGFDMYFTRITPEWLTNGKDSYK